MVGPQSPIFAIAVHGGAGATWPADSTPDSEARFREGLGRALDRGLDVLRAGANSLDAVEAAVAVLEDDPLFNAGRGAVFNRDGHQALDASIMDGATLAAGAVAGVRTVRNPICLARRVLERSPHVLLAGDGAEAYAAEQGFELVDPAYFRTQRRLDELHRVQAISSPYGTVGAVALDRAGNLAAATSTGGTTGMSSGRIGDSPIIGAGTYARNDACAVSATGNGEYFIRAVAAHDIAARVQYGGATLAAAVDEVIRGEIAALGGDGGAIAVNRKGEIAMAYNTQAMYRASVDGAGTRFIGIGRKTS